jgi:flagellar biosynthesis protein FlhB
MSEDSGDKTEQPTDRRLSEALGKGQFAKSQEIQTALYSFGKIPRFQL